MSFSLDMSKAIDNITEDVEETIKGTLFSLSTLIVQGTPVGNPSLWLYNAGTKEKPRYVDYIAYMGKPEGYTGGTLRGAWNASFGAEDEKLRKSTDKNGKNTLNRISVKLGKYELGDTFYLHNPQPYAYRVEYGWSGQRPEGMVRVALAQAQQVLDSQ